jgi:hypothetical protein
MPASVSGGAGLRAALDFMRLDKKNAAADGGSVARVVLLRGVGETREGAGGKWTTPVPLAVLARVCARELRLSPRAAAGGGGGDARAPPLRVAVPGSKSVSNRALLLAGCARGVTELTGLLASDDTQVMLACLGMVGAEARFGDKGVVTIKGEGDAASEAGPHRERAVGRAKRAPEVSVWWGERSEPPKRA